MRSGTAGWTDETLLASGTFYPSRSLKPAERLAFYAQHFDMVEVDATYYALLPVDTVRRWVDWTPDSFELDVKAHPILTGHPIDIARLPKTIRAELNEMLPAARRVYPDKLPRELAGRIELSFRELVEPLRASGKLGCVMVQYPPWFTATRGNARRIEALADRWRDVPMSVEFRHPSWLEAGRVERVMKLLIDHGLTYTCVDEPSVRGGGVPPVVRVTNPRLSIVRFHGHNASSWRRGASVHERFNYLYAPEELARWVEPVRELAAGSERVHAVFNNCVRNYAVLGAKGLAALLHRDVGEAERDAGNAGAAG